MKKKIDGNQLKSIFNNFLLCSYCIGAFGCRQISNNIYNMGMPTTNGSKDAPIDSERQRVNSLIMIVLKTKANSNATPLHNAVESNNSKAADALIKAGANVNKKNSKGETPLYIAIANDNEGLAELLIDNRADVIAKNNEGNTSLHTAVAKNQIDLVELLIDNRADVIAENNNGETPLHVACMQSLCSIILVMRLINNGADVNAENNNGKTPLDLITDYICNAETIKYLEDNGAKRNKLDISQLS